MATSSVIHAEPEGAVLELDAEATIVRWPARATAWLGWRPEEALGRPLHQLLRPHERSELLPLSLRELASS